MQIYAQELRESPYIVIFKLFLQTLQLDYGEYSGDLVDGRPHGQGTVHFYGHDPLQRVKYEGEWTEGARTGQGSMTFVNGDVYQGQFVQVRVELTPRL